MEIGKNTVVTLSYRVSDPDGNLIDEGREPLVYLHGGYDGIFVPIETALDGRTVGYKVDVKVQPEDAFGEYDPDLVRIEPQHLFPENIEIGMRFERVGEDGEEDELYTITDIAEGKVVVDGNHPLAGTALVFACEVIGVRAATAAEISHGHVHGAGGHHHH
jgi:FKBP-type peptidyl-prolyl cis-trans isomerase SlyD